MAAAPAARARAAGPQRGAPAPARPAPGARPRRRRLAPGAARRRAACPPAAPQRPAIRETPRSPGTSSNAALFQPPPDLLDDEPPPAPSEPPPARPALTPIAERMPARAPASPVFAAPVFDEPDDDAPAPGAAAASPAATVTAPVASPAPPPPPPEAWERIIAHLRQARPALAAVLQHGVGRTITPASIVLLFPTGSFFGQQASAPEALEGIVEAAEAVFGARPTVEIAFARDAITTGTSVAQVEAARDVERREQTRQRALAHPHVTEALRVFPEAAGRVEVAVDVD